MTRRIAGFVAIMLCGCAAQGGPADDASLEKQLVNIERQSWAAWKARDPAFFAQTLTDDHVDVGFQGPIGKAAVVVGVGSPMCVVESYSLRDFRFMRLAVGAAMLVYHAEQKTTCGGVSIPSPAWVSSVYVLREGRWRNAMFQQTAAAAGQAAAEAKCPIAGTRTHWAVDYCMAKLETDDEIAASECLDDEHKRKFKDECAAKRHYKAAMCRFAIEGGQRQDGVEACVADPAFVGSTVRNGGVGGKVP